MKNVDAGQVSAYRYGVYDGRVRDGDVEVPLPLGSERGVLRVSEPPGRSPGLHTVFQARSVVGRVPRRRCGGVVMSVNGIGRLGRPPVLGLAAVVWLVGWLLILGAHSTMANAQAVPAPHAAQVSLMPVGGEFTLNVDHPHVDQGSSSAHPERFATAVLPRSAPAAEALVGLGVLAAAALIGWRIDLRAACGRGPPPSVGAYLSGQDRLTRFCLSRR